MSLPWWRSDPTVQFPAVFQTLVVPIQVWAQSPIGSNKHAHKEASRQIFFRTSHQLPANVLRAHVQNANRLPIDTFVQ